MIVSTPRHDSLLEWVVELRPDSTVFTELSVGRAEWKQKTEEKMREWCDNNDFPVKILSSFSGSWETIVYLGFKTESDAMLCYMAFA